MYKHFKRYALQILMLVLIALTSSFADIAPVQAQTNSAVDCKVAATSAETTDDRTIMMHGDIIARNSGTGTSRTVVYSLRKSLASVTDLKTFPFISLTGLVVNTASITDMKLEGMFDGHILFSAHETSTNRRALYLHSIAQGHNRRISPSTTGYDRETVQTDGQKIVWVQRYNLSDGDGNYIGDRVMIYNIATNTTETISQGETIEGRYDLSRPVIKGDQLLYTHRVHTAPDSTVYLMNLSGNTRTNFAYAPAGSWYRGYNLTNNWAVLHMVTSTGSSSLFRRSLTAPYNWGNALNSGRVLTTGTGTLERGAYAVDGDRIAWVEAFGNNYSVYVADLNTPEIPAPLATDTYLYENVSVRLNGNWLVTHGRSNTWRQATVHNLKTDTAWEFLVTNWGGETVDASGKFVVTYQPTSGVTLTSCNNKGTLVPPRIYRHGSDQVVGMDKQFATVSISLEGTLNYRYQWYRGTAGDTSQPLLGQQHSRVSVPMDQLELGVNHFWARGRNAGGHVDSRTFNIYLLPQTTTYFEDFLFDHPEFEDGLGNWRLKNGTGDKIKCDNPEKDKWFSNAGNCAFMFKGGVGENSALQLKVNYNPAGTTEERWNYGTGWLSIIAQFDVRRYDVNATMKVVVKYNDGTPNSKSNVRLYGTDGGYEHVPVVVPVMSTNVSQIVVKVEHKSIGGKMFVDSFGSFFYPGDVTSDLRPLSAGDLLPLPLPPSEDDELNGEFRGLSN